MTGPPRTILFFDHTAQWSGGEIALYNLLTHLDRARYTPLVLLASEGPLAERLCAAGIETLVWPLSRSVIEARKDSLGTGTLLKVRQAGLCLGYAARLARLARQRRVALIHCNSLKSDLIGGLAARLAGRPCLWHVRDHINAAYLPRRVAQAFRALARHLPAGVVVNSTSTLAELSQGRPLRFSAIAHDGVPPEAFEAPVRADTPEQTGGPRVILVGRISPWKGQDVFIRAAAQLAQAGTNARFQIVGSAMFGEEEYARSLHRLAAETGVAERVEFLGFREDIPALLQSAAIVVHASTIGEPFGQVVIEGMAAGKPVIATDGGALREIVVSGTIEGPPAPGETGLLVPMGDAQALAAAIAALLADPERARAMGRAGRCRVQQQFTISQTARKVEAAFDRLLAGGPVPGDVSVAAQRAQE
jgi:glycosyltransferase involved in cell wall biosynthesis